MIIRVFLLTTRYSTGVFEVEHAYYTDNVHLIDPSEGKDKNPFLLIWY